MSLERTPLKPCVVDTRDVAGTPLDVVVSLRVVRCCIPRASICTLLGDVAPHGMEHKASFRQIHQSRPFQYTAYTVSMPSTNSHRNEHGPRS